jgi:hypothetical protein
LTSAAETKHGEYIKRVLLASAVGLMLLQPFLPMLIVNFSLLRVTKNVVRVGDLLHALLSLLVAGIFVGMELQAQLTIRALDFLFTGALFQTQDGVVVSVSQYDVQGKQSDKAA